MRVVKDGLNIETVNVHLESQNYSAVPGGPSIGNAGY